VSKINNGVPPIIEYIIGVSISLVLGYYSVRFAMKSENELYLWYSFTLFCLAEFSMGATILLSTGVPFIEKIVDAAESTTMILFAIGICLFLGPHLTGISIWLLRICTTVSILAGAIIFVLNVTHFEENSSS